MSTMTTPVYIADLMSKLVQRVTVSFNDEPAAIYYDRKNFSIDNPKHRADFETGLVIFFESDEGKYLYPKLNKEN